MSWFLKLGGFLCGNTNAFRTPRAKIVIEAARYSLDPKYPHDEFFLEVADQGIEIYSGLNKWWVLILHGKVHWFKNFFDAQQVMHRHHDLFKTISRVEIMYHRGEVTSTSLRTWDGANAVLHYKTLG